MRRADLVFEAHFRTEAAAEFLIRYHEAFAKLPPEEQQIPNREAALEQEQRLTQAIVQQMQQEGWEIPDDFTPDVAEPTSLPLTTIGHQATVAASHLSGRIFVDMEKSLHELARHGIVTREEIERTSREAERYQELRRERAEREARDRDRARNPGRDR